MGLGEWYNRQDPWAQYAIIAGGLIVVSLPLVGWETYQGILRGRRFSP